MFYNLFISIGNILFDSKIFTRYLLLVIRYVFTTFYFYRFEKISK